MNVNGEIDVTYGVFRRMTLSYLGVRMLVSRLFGVVVLVGGTFTHVRDHLPGLPVRSVLGGLVFIGLPELLVLLYWVFQRRRVAGLNRFVVTAGGLDVDRAGGRQRLEWSGVARVQRGRYSWSVRPDGIRSAILIPRVAFSTEDRVTINDFFLRHPEFAG